MSSSLPMPLTAPPIDRAELRARLDRVPRVSLAKLPTPLDDAPRLSELLGGPRILIKRDDLTGLAFGGNKTRMLEFRMADALRQGADCIVYGSAAQSNHCRQLSAAGARVGLKVYLVLKERRLHPDPHPQGNLLLDHLLGADVAVIGRDDDTNQREAQLALAERLRREGHRPYLAPDDDPLGPLAYVNLMLELTDQLEARGIRPSRVYVCSGRVTQSGMIAGTRCLGDPFAVVGINPYPRRPDTLERMAALANEAARLLGVDTAFSAEDVDNVDHYVGREYGIPTPASIEAIRLVGQTEGILLDPIYSGRAMAGLIDHVRKGKVGKDETVVFVHTGGTPALFAYSRELAD